jgi:predicted DNA-binding protein (MmcQ/YjbR family)
MDIEFIRDYCLKKRKVKEELPFGPQTLVFKVAGKMFLACSLDETPLRLSVKCDPELAIELREKYTDVIPGYHLNKKMWNTIYLTGSIPQKEILTMIDHSYNEVVKGLPKKLKSELEKK